MFPLERLDRGRAVGQRRVDVARRRAVGLAERRLDIVGVRRLGEIVGRAELDRLDRGRDAGIARQHDDPRRRVMRVDRLDARQPRGRAELEIDHREIGGALGKRARHGSLIGSDLDLISAALERAAQRAGERAIVLDDQQMLLAHTPSHSSAESGKVNVTTAPPLGRLRASTDPPSLRIALTTRNSPSPLPSRSRVE